MAQSTRGNAADVQIGSSNPGIVIVFRSRPVSCAWVYEVAVDACPKQGQTAAIRPAIAPGSECYGQEDMAVHIQSRRSAPRWELLTPRILALPLLSVVAYLLRGPLVDFLILAFGMDFIFDVVHIYSTLAIRLLVAVLAILALTLLWALTGLLRQRNRATVFSAVAALCISILGWKARSAAVGFEAGLLAAALLSANTLTKETWRSVLERPLVGRLISAAFWLGIGFEALFPRPFLFWIRQLPGPGRCEDLRFLPGSLLCGWVVALLVPTSLLMQAGQALFMSKQAEIVFGPRYQFYSPYDVSDIARDGLNGKLYFCGDAQADPKVYNPATGEVTGLGIPNRGNEFCEFAGGRFITFDALGKELLVIDPSGPSVLQRLPMGDLPNGEISLAAHPALPLLIVASENEGGAGTAPDIRVVDLDSGKVIREIDDDVGYVITDPRRPVAYINEFRMDLGVRAYDMFSGQKIASSIQFGHSDRMAFDAKRDEVLATDPEAGRIRRFDAGTLEARNPYDTVYGARGLAVDSKRDLLLVSSFLNNRLDVIDLATGRSLRRYWLGPWLRDVLVVSDKGVAYVASRYGVYRVNYLK